MKTNPQIISVSRRTDIPAFYAPWFMNRLRAGFCLYPNPLYRATVHRVSLLPEDVLGFVFWTRHAVPMLPHLDELERFGRPFYFSCTLLGYPRAIDPGSPDVPTALAALRALSARIGPSRVIWRYDPIVFARGLDSAWHVDNFCRLADALCGVVRHVVVSIADPYARTRRRLGTADDGVVYDPEAYIDLVRLLAAEARLRGLILQSCAEIELGPDVARGGCVDGDLLLAMGAGSASGTRFRLHGQRAGCLCHRSVDIGVNDTCGFGCSYCYATADPVVACDRLRRHDPAWTSIIGDLDFGARRGR